MSQSGGLPETDAAATSNHTSAVAAATKAANDAVMAATTTTATPLAPAAEEAAEAATILPTVKALGAQALAPVQLDLPAAAAAASGGGKKKKPQHSIPPAATALSYLYAPPRTTTTKTTTTLTLPSSNPPNQNQNQPPPPPSPLVLRDKFIVDGIDISKCPAQWKSIATAPSANKRSIWWKVYHVIRGEEDGKDSALCNLCCKVLSRGNSASTSSMKKHISHCHPKLYPTLLEMEGHGGGGGSADVVVDTKEADPSDAPTTAATLPVTIVKRKPRKPQKARQQVKVSFVSSAGTNKNVDDDDDDDDGKMPAAAGVKLHGNSKRAKGSGSTSSSSSSSTGAGRPRFMIGMIDDIDITKCPEEYKDRATAPAPNKRSIWWNAYHEIKVDGEDGNVCALCNLCSKILSMGNSASTSCMRRHMMHCHPNIYPILLELENHTNIIASASNAVSGKSGAAAAVAAGGESSSTLAGKRKRDRQDDQQSVLGNSPNGSSDGIPANAWATAVNKKRKIMLAETHAAMDKQFFNDLSMYAAFANRPFPDYDQARFRQFIEAAVQHGRGLGMAGLANAFELPAADSIQVNLHELAEQAEKKLKLRLHGKKLTATTDHWISRARCNYATLAVHWIEDFAMHSAVLAAYMFKGVAVVDQLLEDFDSKLDEWGISKSVLYVVTDTEEKMNKFGEMVYEQLGIEQINCIDYSLQLVAEIAFDAVLNTDDKDLEECCDELSDFDDEDMEDDVGSGDGGGGDEDKDKDKAGVSEEDKKPKAIDTKCTLRKCRGIVGYFSRSREATDQLKKLQIQDDDLFDDHVDESKDSLLPVPDVVPRWWSTLAMVDRLLILKGPLGLFESVNGFKQRCRGKKRGKKQVPIEMPGKQEWETLVQLQKLLKPLEAARKILEGSKYVTSSLVLYIVHVIHGELVAISELTGRADENISTIATKMLETFEQQFGSDLSEPFAPTIERQVDNKQNGLSKVYVFAHALDPRFKSLAAIAVKDKQNAIWDALHKEMVALGPPKPPGACTARSTCDAQIDAADKKDDPDEKSSWASGSKFDAYAVAQPPNESDAVDHDKWRLQCKTEIMAYQREPGLGLTKKNENPLVWWKENAVSYPTLWRLAEIYLAVPATAAKSDRAFSIQGNMVTMMRCQSKTDTSEDCHFLHENAWILDDE